jgi:GT2 family glycosyltransferase
MKTAVVMPVGPGRGDNVRQSIESLAAMTTHPHLLLVVCDGEVDLPTELDDMPFPAVALRAPKHEPGMEQPRNIGVRRLEDTDIDTAWFLDSDIIVAPEALERFEEAMDGRPRILVGPYDWLPPGTREPMSELKNDPRWASFEEHGWNEVMVENLSAGLACFSGNLVWPIDEFARIGGFWNELHHGRCEDGELGLRAVACGVPISMVAGARGWHLAHAVDFELTLQRNERDVPMLNERHPWVEGEGLFVVEEDGKRFNVRCKCGWEGNTAEIWAHQHECEEAV